MATFEDDDYPLELVALPALAVGAMGAWKTGDLLGRWRLRRARRGGWAAPRAPERRPGGTLFGQPTTSEVPESLHVHPTTRLWWCGGWVAGGVGLAVVLGLTAGEDPTARVVGLGGGAGAVLLGLAGLRFGLHAGASGITIGRLVRTRTVPWSEVEDIVLLPVEGSLPSRAPRYWMALSTSSGPERVDGLTGGERRLTALRRTLLAMRDRAGGLRETPVDEDLVRPVDEDG